MRLDQFLRASRLVVRRTVAQELCEAGAVEVNGAAARSSRAVRAGDRVAVRRRNRRVEVLILELPEARQPSRAAAAASYELLADERVEDEGPAGGATDLSGEAADL
jgi:ribosomal 50S subunit-recycling heat shock protein